jgi:tripartite-type tricarboxylate transporter receptor subunit TctC
MENGVSDFEASSWVALLAPAKTPRTIINRINQELNAILNDPEVKERLNGMGISATPGTPESFGAELSKDFAKYGPVVKAAGIRAE